MARMIQDHIKKPLADEVLFGQLKGGGHVHVVLVKDEASAEGKDKIGLKFVEGRSRRSLESCPAPASASRNRAEPRGAARRGRHRRDRW